MGNEVNVRSIVSSGSLKGRFKDIDTDRDGRISREEYNNNYMLEYEKKTGKVLQEGTTMYKEAKKRVNNMYDSMVVDDDKRFGSKASLIGAIGGGTIGGAIGIIGGPIGAAAGIATGGGILTGSYLFNTHKGISEKTYATAIDVFDKTDGTSGNAFPDGKVDVNTMQSRQKLIAEQGADAKIFNGKSLPELINEQKEITESFNNANDKHLTKIENEVNDIKKGTDRLEIQKATDGIVF